MNQEIKKVPDLSVYRYFEKLQREWLVAELRSKIYPKSKDKKFWKERVMKGKEITIKDIAAKNLLDSIFSNKEKEMELRKEIYRERGLPNFLYVDEKQRALQEENDVHNYYYPGSEVKVYRGPDLKEIIGKIHAINFEAGIVEVRSLDEDDLITVRMDCVTRIL